MYFLRCVYLFNLFYIISGVSLRRFEPIVITPLGRIVGYNKESYKGRTYKAFEAIPYALPPVNDRRFKDPEPITEWKGAIFANNGTRTCIQYSPEHRSNEGKVRGDEDCLYLNIYVPAHDNKLLLPVLFAIHAGAFTFGKPYDDLTFMMDKYVIFVSISFRLGPFGFLSTEDEHLPGNMGLKDQSMALKWVHNNIKYFGGDPEQITLIGNSAGAACVHFHYLSPLSKGLFRNGISFSGSALTAGMIQSRSLEKFKKFASALSCPTENIPDAIKCLQEKPANMIAEGMQHFKFWMNNPMTPFGPVVEKRSRNPFINRLPEEIINGGDAADVLWISSLVKDEGLYPAAEFISNEDHLRELNDDWYEIAPHLLMYNFTVPFQYINEVSERVREHYLGTREIGEDTLKELIALIGDRLYAFGSIKAAKLQATLNTSPVYFWKYSHRSQTSLTNFLTKKTENYGVCHCDDVLTIHGDSVIYPPNRQEDRDVQVKLINFIISVANKETPYLGQGFEWTPVQGNDTIFNYLHFVDANDVRMESGDEAWEYDFWSTIDTFENRKLVDLFKIIKKN